MSGHSNKKIQQHVEDSTALVAKMQLLTDALQDVLRKNFEQTMGLPLPNITNSVVRETDIAMVYSTDPTVDEYINGARKLLGAALGGETLDVINGMLDLVDVIAQKIIGAGEIKTGIHSTAARTGEYITAAFCAVQKASAKDWATTADFFVSYYVFVVFKPTVAQEPIIVQSLGLEPMVAKRAIAPAADVRTFALRRYAHTPL